MMTCNVISPLFLDQRKSERASQLHSSCRSFVNIGMVPERFVIIVTSLHRDWCQQLDDVPSHDVWHRTVYLHVRDFLHGILAFTRFFPVINMAEVKSIIKATSEKKAINAWVRTKLSLLGIFKMKMCCSMQCPQIHRKGCKIRFRRFILRSRFHGLDDALEYRRSRLPLLRSCSASRAPRWRCCTQIGCWVLTGRWSLVGASWSIPPFIPCNVWVHGIVFCFRNGFHLLDCKWHETIYKWSYDLRSTNDKHVMAVDLESINL